MVLMGNHPFKRQGADELSRKRLVKDDKLKRSEQKCKTGSQTWKRKKRGAGDIAFQPPFQTGSVREERRRSL